MIPTSPRADTGGRPLTRRRFLEDGLSLLVAGGVLGACGGGKRAQAPAPATTATAAGKPVRGGTLVFSASSEPSGFDAARWWNPLSWSGTVNVFDRLVRTTDKGTFEPELLSGLPEVNSDGTQYTLRLQPGVKFHNGRALTADDVKFSLERLVNPETASEGASLYTGLTIPGMDGVVNQKSKELEGIEVVDDGTLTIALEKPDSVFLYLLGLPFAGIVPRDVVEEVGDKKFNFAPVGTGPFLMKDVDPSKGLALERNPAYWD